MITEAFVETICKRLAGGQRVRRNLPGWGRLHIDRPLPFLCVYRLPAHGNDEGTERLVTTEASYIICSGAPVHRAKLALLVKRVVETLASQFGAFLLIEIWSGQAGGEPAENSENRKPRFRIHSLKGAGLGAFLDHFEDTLSHVRLRKQPAEVEVHRSRRTYAGTMGSLLPAEEARDLGCTLLGLEVAPVYRGPGGAPLYPVVLRELRRGLSRCLKQAFYRFVLTRTRQRPPHFHALGRRAVVKAVWDVDRQIAEVSDQFDFLLQVTPTNSEQAWLDFRRSGFDKVPVFHYRPMPIDPVVLKRRLYRAPIERIEDPALAQLLRGIQDELDRKITMLADINTRRFLHGSIQVFGSVGTALNDLAEEMLSRISPRAREEAGGRLLDANAFAARARSEIEHYRRLWAGVTAGVQVRDDVVSGLMVSRGSLLIGRKTRIPESRADALLQHEVGTHVLTYFNGRAQPFRQLYSGLAGYEPLQEGLAVLAEYLVGGLSRPRLRLLAARVAVVRDMVGGASFMEAYRKLTRDHGYAQRTAFTIVMRVYRGGGLTKDAVYLQGLHQLLGYISKGGEIEPLLVGKIAASDAPIIQELLYREILRKPPLRPRYLDQPEAVARLESLRRGVNIFDLIRRRKR